MIIWKASTAVVLLDPNNDVLSKSGASRGPVPTRMSVNHAVETMKRHAVLSTDEVVKRMPRGAA